MTANFFETRLTFDGPRNAPTPLRPLFSGVDEGKAIRRAAVTRCCASLQVKAPMRACGNSWPGPTGHSRTGRPCPSRRATLSR